jgi:hypothetical protein
MVRLFRISLGLSMVAVGVIQIIAITNDLVIAEALIFSSSGLLLIASELTFDKPGT